ncbi:hypothetical protein H6P81_017227 [Aristolochia fimbriata]|uniref:Uncharacterized protein n=1 Tax=Aristolochia fimbriata TaxID=158543 RepID=A0AAV7DYJ3_ARIFI|nr:hypothetical protein H6P81_017227 [Aristolochia fimbriata]
MALARGSQLSAGGRTRSFSETSYPFSSTPSNFPLADVAPFSSQISPNSRPPINFPASPGSPEPPMMTRGLVIRDRPTPVRRRTLSASYAQPSTGSKIAETAGNTAAECAAVCCCCPCGLLDLVVTTFVKLPGGLCHRAIRNSRRRRRAKRIGQGGALRRPEMEEESDRRMIFPIDDIVPWSPDRSPSIVVLEVENEMWTKFYNNGFWRSISERERPEMWDPVR